MLEHQHHVERQMLSTSLQMGPGSMMPGFDWGSMWLYMVIPSVIVAAAIVVIVLVFLRRETSAPSVTATGYPAPTITSVSPYHEPKNLETKPTSVVLGDVFRSLVPTLMDDEKRVMDELTRAGGEVLQSDLPKMTNFSKATVSKVIHSLEVRGIVLREKHKWTYWCKINPRLVERVQRGELTIPGDQNPETVSS